MNKYLIEKLKILRLYFVRGSYGKPEQRDCEYFGVKGFMYVPVCKECYREQQLNKIV